jgi:hypothetical protein
MHHHQLRQVQHLLLNAFRVDTNGESASRGRIAEKGISHRVYYGIAEKGGGFSEKVSRPIQQFDFSRACLTEVSTADRPDDVRG